MTRIARRELRQHAVWFMESDEQSKMKMKNAGWRSNRMMKSERRISIAAFF